MHGFLKFVGGVDSFNKIRATTRNGGSLQTVLAARGPISLTSAHTPLKIS